jgi:hypothetical protein
MSTFAYGWKKQKVIMVSLDGINEMLKANAHTVWTCSLDVQVLVPNVVMLTKVEKDFKPFPNTFKN